MGLHLDFLEGQLAFDCFLQAADLYFLTHCHWPQISGVDRLPPFGKLITSPANKKFLRILGGPPPDQIVTLELGEQGEFTIGTGKVRVRTVDANHCPGAVMFHLHFFGGSGNNHRRLFTGDFRAQTEQLEFLASLGSLDHLYYDATFAMEERQFPTQRDTILEIVDIIRSHPRRTIYLAIYRLGRVGLIKGIHEVLGLKVYLPFDKRRLAEAAGLTPFVTHAKRMSRIHAFHQSYILEHWERLDPAGVFIFPTGRDLGWRPADRRKRLIYTVPYSEHCDAEELQGFICGLSPKEKTPIGICHAPEPQSPLGKD